MTTYFIIAGFTFLVCEWRQTQPLGISAFAALAWPVFWVMWVILFFKKWKEEYDRLMAKERRKKYLEDNGKDD